MMDYRPQVNLLLTVLPEVAKEKYFALHGGTAINLFVRNMPRLSVDADLTYIPIGDRSTTFKHINSILSSLKKRIETIFPNLKIIHQTEILKLQISNHEAQIKLEVNQGIRGTISEPIALTLCERAQETFDTFCSILTVPFGQLYGGKVCAALDRQHPRDLFDIKQLLVTEGITEAVKTGFLFSMLSSKRPIQEILFPNFINQEQAFTNQFQGMTDLPYTYDDYKNTRHDLVTTIHQNLTEIDRSFILGFENTTPDWRTYNFEKYPAVQWKLENLKKLKDMNPKKHRAGIKMLEDNL